MLFQYSYYELSVDAGVGADISAAVSVISHHILEKTKHGEKRRKARREMRLLIPSLSVHIWALVNLRQGTPWCPVEQLALKIKPKKKRNKEKKQCLHFSCTDRVMWCLTRGLCWVCVCVCVCVCVGGGGGGGDGRWKHTEIVCACKAWGAFHGNWQPGN